MDKYENLLNIFESTKTELKELERINTKEIEVLLSDLADLENERREILRNREKLKDETFVAKRVLAAVESFINRIKIQEN